MLPFLIALLTLLIFALWKRHDAAGTAAVLLANWCILSLVCWITEDRFPWPMFLTVDYLSALAIFAMMKSRWQAGIAVIYVAQIICHAAYAFSGKSVPVQDHYWWTLTFTGWAQLAVFGGWMVAGLVRGADRAGGGASPDFATNGSYRDQAGEP